MKMVRSSEYVNGSIATPSLISFCAAAPWGGPSVLAASRQSSESGQTAKPDRPPHGMAVGHGASLPARLPASDAIRRRPTSAPASELKGRELHGGLCTDGSVSPPVTPPVPPPP